MCHTFQSAGVQNAETQSSVSGAYSCGEGEGMPPNLMMSLKPRGAGQAAPKGWENPLPWAHPPPHGSGFPQPSWVRGEGDFLFLGSKTEAIFKKMRSICQTQDGLGGHCPPPIWGGCPANSPPPLGAGGFWQTHPDFI